MHPVQMVSDISLWSQIAMQAVTGPSLGKHLEPIFLEHTTWKAWQESHPHTLVLSRETGFTRDYSRDPYQHYTQTDRLLFPPSRQDNRLAPKEWVLGVKISETFKAYPFSALEELGSNFSDSIQDQHFVVCWDGQARSAKILDKQGKPLPSLTAYWFAWSTFHPDTAIFIRDSKQPKLKTLHAVCQE